MKVEVSSMKKFQQLKKPETNKQSVTQQEGLGSRSSAPRKAAEGSQRSKPLKRELVEAASAVASSLPLNKKQTESELLAQLRRHEETTDKQKMGGIVNIRNVISDMTIKRESPAQRGARISNLISLEFEEDGKRIKSERVASQSSDSRRSLKVGRRLNIFTKTSPDTEKTLTTASSPTIWDLEFAKEIAAVTEQPPRNGFEEMIQWTKEGILWEFPIDNEAAWLGPRCLGTKWSRRLWWPVVVLVQRRGWDLLSAMGWPVDKESLYVVKQEPVAVGPQRLVMWKIPVEASEMSDPSG
ncbi:PREDICTED: 28S ribosomal protein S31, mitochondrial [Tinamus guttatus]|uniref:28S ribosomal protein S31, mitochondrial n=1 Tax=Tinamus guttatus TaxID=94827 RepID=UPI00052E9D75|nr:PREDICTED: 28S ribosomal protein S31, mitochondrial [Tinamus guttatus]